MTVHDHPGLRLGALSAHVADILERGGRDADPAQRMAACILAVEAMGLVPDDMRQDLLAAMVEAEWQGMPSPVLGPIIQEARFWAQRADRLEAEAYLTALCDVLQGATLAEAARKRLMLTLWEGLPDAWRRRFIERVAK